jgi:hypothetical protein
MASGTAKANFDAMTYAPKPLDTSTVELPKALGALVELLAENAHETWAQMRIAEGWRYGPSRDDKAQTHPCLIPYTELPDSEQEYDRQLAISTIKIVMGMGYTIIGPETPTY